MCTAAMVDRFLASKCTCRLYMVFVVNLKCNERRALKYIDQSQEWVFQEMWWWWWRSGSTMKKIQIHTAACAVVIEIGFSPNKFRFGFALHCIRIFFHSIFFSISTNFIKESGKIGNASKTEQNGSIRLLYCCYTQNINIFLAQPVIHQL